MAIHSSSKNWKPYVRGAAVEIDTKFPRPDWTSTYPGHGENSSVGAYAIDFMCSRAIGDKIAEYVWANRVRLNVWYIIWYGRIISRTDEKGGKTAAWKRYYNADSPDPSKSHKNHVHVSFYVSTKAYVPPATSYVPVTKPADKVIYLDLLKPGVKGSESVYHLQVLLNKANGENITVDGWYGNESTASVKVFQKAMGATQSGDITKVQLFALLGKTGLTGYTVRDKS